MDGGAVGVGAAGGDVSARGWTGADDGAVSARCWPGPDGPAGNDVGRATGGEPTAVGRGADGIAGTNGADGRENGAAGRCGAPAGGGAGARGGAAGVGRGG
jgi:hypothetical protein